MIDIVGLGPGDIQRLPDPMIEFLLDPDRAVVVRTRHHPAAAQLAKRREVTFCDDLYESFDDFDSVYEAIADRVIGLAADGDVIYAVPGSPRVGELAVGKIRARAEATVHPAESFLDTVLDIIGIDPLADGLQVLNGHEFPPVPVFDRPTVIGHLDDPTVLGEVGSIIDRTAPEGFEVTLICGAGASDEVVWRGRPAQVDQSLAGYRTSMYVPAHPNGIVGAISMMRTLRDECPWDRKQTHESLIRYLVEDTHELIDALTWLVDAEPEDLGAYAEVEDELGDVLLQVLFHAVIAEDAGAFTISDVAHQLREKMVRRHPHVFGDVQAADAETVRRNWDEIKAAERPTPSGSLLDGIPSMPALARAVEVSRRAARVGFDWDSADELEEVVAAEMRELFAAGDAEAIRHELGDVLFSVVNLARHLDVDPEVALRSAAGRFERRFRSMEERADLTTLDLVEMNRLWEEVKKVR